MTIQFMEGEFTMEDASTLLQNFVETKIKYHEAKVSTSDNEEDIKYRESKIKNLQNLLNEIKKILVNKNKPVTLEGVINIK